MAGQSVIISVLADTKKFSRDMDTATQGAGGFGKAMKGLGVAAAAAAAAGVAAFGAFIATSVKAAAEAERVAAQTAAVLASTGAAAGRSAEQISDLATELSKLSGVDDEVIQSGANVLLTFTKIQGVNFDKATAAALDLSVALGQDMKSASILVGKALNDPIAGLSALSRAGVQFTDQQKEQIKAMVAAGDAAGAQAMILQELNTQFGGSAAAFGNTYLGAVGRVQTAFGNLQEQVGGAILPALTTGLGKVADLINRIGESPGFQAFTTNFGELVSGVLDGSTSFADIGTAIRDGISKAADWLANGGIQQLVEGFIAGRAAMFDAAVVIFQGLVEALVEIVPQLVAGLVSMITTLVDLLVKSVPTIIEGAIQLFQGLLEGIVKILPDLIKQVVGLVPVIVDTLLNLIPTLLDAAITFFETLLDAVVAIYPDLLDQIIGMLPGIISALIALIPKLIDGAIRLFMALVEALPVILPVLIQAIVDLIPIIIEALVNAIPALIEGAIQLFLALVEAIPIIIPAVIKALIGAIPQIVKALITAVPKILQAGIELFGALISAVGQIIPKLLKAGGDLIQGLWDGVTRAWDEFMGWWNRTVGGVVDTIKSALGIASPSKVFAGIGRNLIEGLVGGINGSLGLVSGAMGNIEGQLTGGFSTPAIAGGSSGRGPAIEINFNGLVTDPISTGREVQRVLDDYFRAGGRR